MTYRRVQFDTAFDLLQKLRNDPTTLPPLIELQKLLLQEILRAEEYQNKIKVQQTANTTRLKKDRPPKAVAKRLKARATQLEERLTAYRNLAYYWRLFGDAVAFTYLDKHAIKHAYFSTENTAVKQSAGYITGKEGLLGEIALLEEATSHGIPAILADLTNSIRHGDVCLLGGPDPYLIEVKNGQHLGTRGRKQVAAIEKLHEFYEKDTVADLRGIPSIRRAEGHSREVAYINELNACIDEALRSGTAISNPERGLYYIATCEDEPPIIDLVAPLNLKKAIFYGLNESKYERAWAPYQPFVLSIDKKDNLYAFLRGDIFLIVIVDTSVLCDLMSEPGNPASFEYGRDYPLTIGEDSDNRMGISQQFLNRIAFEFVSPAWIIAAQKHMVARVKEESGRKTNR